MKLSEGIKKLEELTGRKVKLIEAPSQGQQRFDYFRGFGIAPSNQPETSKYIKAVLKPGKFFVDWSGELIDGPYALKFIKQEGRNFFIFQVYDLTKKQLTNKTYEVMGGNLGRLRPAYGIQGGAWSENN